MKNLASIKNVLALTMILMTLGLTACSDGGGGGKQSKASTNTCPNNAYYDAYTGEWFVSYNNHTICNPLPGANTHGCRNGEVTVRSPYQYDSNYDPRLLNQTNYSNHNYHNQKGLYKEICMQQGGSGWSHVTNAGGYFYVNLGLINTTIYGNPYYRQPPIVHQPYQNNNTAALLTLGVLAALFLMN